MYKRGHGCVHMHFVGLNAEHAKHDDFVCTVHKPGAGSDPVVCPFQGVAEAGSCGHFEEWDGQYVIGDGTRKGGGCWGLTVALAKSFWSVDEYTALARLRQHWIGSLFLGEDDRGSGIGVGC